MRSQPISANALAMATVSASLMPPSFQSQAEMRTDMGLSSGQTSRMAANTSSG